MQKGNLTIEGHEGTWYVIEEAIYNGEKVYLLESEQYGDEAACLIVDKNLKILAEDVWNGFFDTDLY